MSRRYTDEEKAYALQCLADNFYNVNATSLQTRIPIRTLHAWKRERKLQHIDAAKSIVAAAHQSFSGENPLLQHKNLVRQQQQQTTPKPTNGIHNIPIWQQLFDQSEFPPEIDPSDDDPDPIEKEYTHIRQRLMSHVEHLIDTLTDDPLTSHLHITALTRLLDRVIKLESLVRREIPDNNMIEIRYIDTLGQTSYRPPWATSDVMHDAELAHEDDTGPI